jgi:DNA-binding MarR family transcriptional regulator
MPGQLLSEIKQTRPFKTLEEEAAVSLARTSAVIEHAAESLLGEHGVTHTQYNVLRILRGAGPEGLCRNDIGSRMVTQVPDVTRLLDRMEDAGLVERERGADDRRFVRARITRQGLKLLTQLDPPLQGFLKARFGPLGQAKLAMLIDLLAEVRAK